MAFVDNGNLETISLVWLDTMVNSTEENRKAQEKLRASMNYLVTFEKCPPCEEYIRHKIDIQQERIVLIVSGRLGQEIVERIHDLRQVLAIFVFCMDKAKNEQWANRFKKIKGVVVRLDDLVKQIDIYRKSQEVKLDEPMKLLTTNNHLIRLLFQIESSLADRREFLTQCRDEYEGNTNELDKIQEFEHLYSDSNALKWFFDETFLYRLSIKALRTPNIDMLFLLRFFFQDIHKQLETCPPISVRVYRGQLMSSDEVKHLTACTGVKSIHFNSFLIAYRHREQVFTCLQNFTAPLDLHRVLFEIESNQIGRVWQDNILFPLTSSFRLHSVQFEKRTWIARMTCCNDIQSVKNRQITPIQFGHVLRDMGHLDEAERLFQRLIARLPSPDADCYDGLARIAQDRGEYEMSLLLYQESLQLTPARRRAHRLNSIGCAYDNLGQYQQALQFYSKASTAMRKEVDLAMCINNIGVTYAKEDHLDEALECLQQALAVRERFLPQEHTDLGVSHTNIGAIYASQGHLDLALEHYQRALKSFPSTYPHVFTASVYENMAHVYRDKGQSDQALAYYKKATTIFHQVRPQTHPNLLDIDQLIHLLTQNQ